MLECKDIRPLLPEYAAGTLAEDVARQVEDHLLLCPICAGILEQLRAAEYHAPLIQPVMGLPRTTPPEIKKQPSEAEKASAPQPETASAPQPKETPAEEALPKKQPRLSRRGKVLLALAALLVALGVLLALLISRDVFSIRDRVPTADKSWTAVMYRGAEKGAKDGFRIRLWTDGDWARETVFHGMEYKQMVWSPDGRFLALELLDQGGKSTVYVMDTQYQQEGNLAALLETYLSQTEGLFGNSFLSDVPACTILQWLPDSSALLVAGEGTVDTEVDPDYGIQFAGSTASSGTGSNETTVYSNPDLTTVSGYFSYLPETGEIQNIIGFGTPAYEGEEEQTQNDVQKAMRDLLKRTKTYELSGYQLYEYFGQAALLQAFYLKAEGALEVDMVDLKEQTITKVDPYTLTYLKQLDNLTLLIARTPRENKLYYAYLLIPKEDLPW